MFVGLWSKLNGSASPLMLITHRESPAFAWNDMSNKCLSVVGIRTT